VFVIDTWQCIVWSLYVDIESEDREARRLEKAEESAAASRRDAKIENIVDMLAEQQKGLGQVHGELKQLQLDMAMYLHRVSVAPDLNRQQSVRQWATCAAGTPYSTNGMQLHSIGSRFSTQSETRSRRADNVRPAVTWSFPDGQASMTSYNQWHGSPTQLHTSNPRSRLAGVALHSIGPMASMATDDTGERNLPREPMELAPQL